MPSLTFGFAKSFSNSFISSASYFPSTFSNFSATLKSSNSSSEMFLLMFSLMPSSLIFSKVASIVASSLGMGRFISGLGNTKLQNARENMRYVDVLSLYKSSPCAPPLVFLDFFFLFASSSLRS
ncbi:NPH-I transcription termination factor [Chrysochromulina parva virus BQ2]|uniref:NPH-I transcription termination factor n=1 Tax=Chrysochromulina parva virus BQ2 TaxID=3070831 RepID=A0A4Y6GRD4_9VIRU|nr:NPH-I transcription termination factor [Chrysochromulina parva virus]QDF45928.1 NPH-I transcription termination factor [Chrysochromulina parva virus BQ2]